MKYLLDINVCIRAMQAHPQVIANMVRHSPDDFGVSMVTIFELFAGVERCRQPEQEKEKVLRFLQPLHLLPFDWDSALHAASIRWALEKNGNKIGPYDLQIAAQAIALDATLVSHNQREFSRVPGLKTVDWES